MKTSVIVSLHIGYWLLYSFLFTFLFVISRATGQSAFDDWDDWLIILILASLTGLISFYSVYWWLVPRYLITRQVKQFVGLGVMVSMAVALLMTTLFSLAVTVILYITLHHIQLIVFQPDDQLILMGGFSGLALVNSIMGTVLRGFITWYADIHVKETLINKTLQTELALLQARINPHFLFNTLNNIDVLLERDAPTASRYLNQLADLLRFVLYETKTETIPLTKELEYIQKYVALQRIRTTNEQYVGLQIDGQPDGMTIAPMIFIPYIENAFKYAINKKSNEAIRIQIRIEDQQVHFYCTNVIDKNRIKPETHNGLGNDLLTQRLALLYPDRHTVTIQITETEYIVNVALHLNRNELPDH